MAKRGKSVAVVGLVVAGLAVAGCTAGSSNAGRSSAPAPPTSLAKFYQQKLDWTSCGAAECAKLTVPVDYTKPNGKTIQLAVNKVPATGHFHLP